MSTPAPILEVAAMDEAADNQKLEDVKISDDVTNHTYDAALSAETNFIIDSTEAQRAERRSKAHLLKTKFEGNATLKSLLDTLKPDELATFWTVDTCERYLVARDMNAKKAIDMLIATLQWRAKERPWDITYEDVKECMEAGSVYISGRCKVGRPLFYMSAGAVNSFPAEMRMKLITYLLEESFRQGHQQLTWIFNFSRLGENKGTDPEAKKTRKLMMSMFQAHYPERLGALHLINTPWYINALATIVWPFMETNTKKKINLKCTAEDLLKFVEKEELDESFGGLKRREHKPLV